MLPAWYPDTGTLFFSGTPVTKVATLTFIPVSVKNARSQYATHCRHSYFRPELLLARLLLNSYVKQGVCYTNTSVKTMFFLEFRAKFEPTKLVFSPFES